MARRGESYETFNERAREAMRYPPLERDELTKIFLHVESLLQYGISVLLHTTSFVEDNVCHLLAEIACGQIKSRKVYRGKRSIRKVVAGQEIEIGATNDRIFGIGFDLFKLAKTDRAIAVPLVQKVLRGLRLSTNIYENILVAFVAEAGSYCDFRDELGALTLRIQQRDRRRKPLIEDMRRINDLIDDVGTLEMNVGCVRSNELYGTIRIVQDVLKRVRREQGRILKAYLRLVPGPARKAAKSELEALDLFQSGSMGLAHAISKYNVRKGASFPKYAAVWIRQRILGSIKRSSRMIRLPTSVLEHYQKIRSAERQLEGRGETRGQWTDNDVADLTGLSLRQIESVRHKVKHAQVVALSDVQPEGEVGYEFLAATGEQEEAEIIDVRANIDGILSHLTPDERRLVCLKYGYVEGILNDIDPRQALLEQLRQVACAAQQHRRAAASSRNLRAKDVDAPLQA